MDKYYCCLHRFRCEYGPKDFSNIVKPISEDLLPKPKKKIRVPDCVPEGSTLAPTRKARAKRTKSSPGRKPRRKFKSKTPVTDAMDFMVQDPVPSPKRRRPRKAKGQTLSAVACEGSAETANVRDIPDLNVLPVDEDHTSTASIPAKKKPTRKKTVPISNGTSVTVEGTPSIKPRKRVSRAKGKADACSECPATSDSGCVTDVAPPKKRAPRKKKGFLDLLQGAAAGCLPCAPATASTDAASVHRQSGEPLFPSALPGVAEHCEPSLPPTGKVSKKPTRKYAPRKKKQTPVTLTDRHQCHAHSSVSGLSGGCCTVEQLPLPPIAQTALPISDSPSVVDCIGVSQGLPPLLSILCDTADALREEIAASVTPESGEDGNVGPGEVVDPGQDVPDAEFPDPKKKTNASIPRPKIKRDSKKKWGNSIKRGCQAQFTVKRLLYLPHISEICIIQEKHVNQDGLIVHGGMKIGDRSAFSAHLSPQIRSFVEDCLRRRDTPNQIMRKHIDLLKQYKAEGKDITRDLFLTTKDIRNISGKLAQETYMLHKNDAQSVRMWVQRNPKNVFYYTESNKEKPVTVPGELTGSNMPFTIGIQTEWQRQMMLQHGHRSGISVNATFGTNERKVSIMLPTM